MATYVPVSVAAKRIGVNERTVRKWAASGRIPARPGPSGAMQVEVDDDTTTAPVNLDQTTAPYAQSKSREKYYQAWLLETRAAQLAQGWAEREQAESSWHAEVAEAVEAFRKLRGPLLEIAPGQDELVDSFIDEALDELRTELDWDAADPEAEIVREDAPTWSGEDYGHSLAREKQAQADIAQHRARRRAGEVVCWAAVLRQAMDAQIRTRQALLAIPMRLVSRCGSATGYEARLEMVNAQEQFRKDYMRVMGPFLERKLGK